MYNLTQSLLTRAQASQADPALAFLDTWLAFTRLAHVVAHEAGLRPTFGLRQNGTLRQRKIEQFKLAEVYPPAESSVLEKAFARLDAAAQHALIAHSSARFFVFRTPTWEGKPLAHDAFRQRLNGVIDASLTLDPRYPAWTPIDIEAYQHYSAESPEEQRAALARQLYAAPLATARNLLYAGAAAAGELTPAVLGHALALLRVIVEGLLSA